MLRFYIFSTSFSPPPPHYHLIADQEAVPVGTGGDLVAGGDDGEYQRVEFPVLFYHKTSGYYYDPVSAVSVSIIRKLRPMLGYHNPPKISSFVQ